MLICSILSALLAAISPKSILTVPGAELLPGGLSFINTESFPMLIIDAPGFVRELMPRVFMGGFCLAFMSIKIGQEEDNCLDEEFFMGALKT